MKTLSHAALKAGPYPDWRLVVERRQGQLHVVENRQLKQYAPEDQPRPDEHRHDYGQNPMPVLSFDLHKTLTPDIGFPLLSAPFEGVKAFLDRMSSRGCCLHVSSASLDNPDVDFNVARIRQVKAWVRQHGLPISWVGPNTEASVRLDDRAFAIPDEPDWEAIGADAEKRMLATYVLGPDGLYGQRDDLVPVGELIDEDTGYPDEDADDQPRGFSTPLIDIDLHRTLMPAWGTKRDAPPEPDAVDVIRRLYAEGYSIQVSCGGWNPATVEEPSFVRDRAAWQRRYLRKWGVPYDRLVTKDDCDLWFDDKSIGYAGDWKQADAEIRKRIGPPIPWRSNNPINEPEPDAPIKALQGELAEVKNLLAAAAEKKPEPAPQPVVVNVHFPEGFGQANVHEGAVKVHNHIPAAAAPGKRTITDPKGRVTVIETE